MKKLFNPFNIFILFSLILYFLSIIIVKADFNFSFRWFVFALWIISIILPFLVLLRNKKITKKIQQVIKELNIRDILPFLFVCFIAIFLSLFLLTDYPFVSVYDQVRDGGLHARQITDGTIKNIFGYGRYESHGLIIPTFTSFFYRIFQNSVLTFRLPAAIVSILDIVILYFLIRKNVNKEAAFWSALILVTIPLHLFYARTEIVVIFSSISTTLAFLGISYFIKYKSYQMFSLLGLFLGFASGFHTSVRTIALFTLILVLTLSFFSIKKLKGKIILGIFIMIISYFIGFGPRILFTTPNIFFHTSEAPLIKTYLLKDMFTSEEKINKNFISELKQIAINYEKSFLVYFREPTISTHYPDFKPLLTPLLGIFFIIGFFAILLHSKNILLKCVLAYSLFIPLSNSALTNMVNADNRLAPLFPVTAIIAGFGIQFIFSKLKKIKILDKKTVLMFAKITLIFYIFFQSFNFFLNETATRQYIPQDYLLMHTIYLLQSDSNYKNTNNMCFFISPNNYNWLSPWYNLLKTQEQFEYFVPNKYIYILQDNLVTDNQIFISKSCRKDLRKEDFNKTTFCSPYKKFVCPPTNKTTPIEVYTENSSNAVSSNIEKLKFVTPAPLFIDPRPQFIP